MRFLLGAALVALGLIVAALVRWRIAFALSGRGDPTGSWALAGGVELSIFALTFGAARGTPLIVEGRAFGRTLIRRLVPSGKEPEPEKKPAPKKPEKPSSRGFPRFLDPIDLLLFITAERRRIALRDLDASVSLGLHDVALAGQIAGMLSVISALLAPFGRLHHQIDWSGKEHLEGSLSLSIRFSPLLLAGDTIAFIFRSVFRRRRARDAAPAPLPAPQRT